MGEGEQLLLFSAWFPESLVIFAGMGLAHISHCPVPKLDFINPVTYYVVFSRRVPCRRQACDGLFFYQ